MLTVACFASSAKDWDSFSVAWKQRLAQDGIEFFRAVDVNSFRGPFEHWFDKPDREALRRSLLSDLMEILKAHAYHRFACTIINKEFQQMSEELREQFALCTYSLAARTCEKYARLWLMEEWRTSPEMPSALIFEAGDRGYGKLQERLANDPGHILPNVRPKKDIVRDDKSIEQYGFVPLQAADWLAWEVNRATRDFYEGKLESESQLRWPMQEFLRYPHGHMGIYTSEDIKEMESGMELQNKIVEWETAIGLGHKKSRSAT
jgi:hypothetical protein